MNDSTKSNKPRRRSLRYLVVLLALLACLLAVRHFQPPGSQEAPGEGPSSRYSSEPRLALRFRFERPNGMSIELDATQHDAAELRDARLIAPVSISLPEDSRFSLTLMNCRACSRESGVEMTCETMPIGPEAAIAVRKYELPVMLSDEDLDALNSGQTITLHFTLAVESGPTEQHSEISTPHAEVASKPNWQEKRLATLTFRCMDRTGFTSPQSDSTVSRSVQVGRSAQ